MYYNSSLSIQETWQQLEDVNKVQTIVTRGLRLPVHVYMNEQQVSNLAHVLYFSKPCGPS